MTFSASDCLSRFCPSLSPDLSHRGISAGARDYGWLLALYGLMQFLFSPLLGALSDRFGRRPVLLLSLLFTGLDYVIMALAPSLVWLYIGRTLSGITGASFTAATAYIADVSPPEKRSQNFGLIGAAFGIGFIIGPAAGRPAGSCGAARPVLGGGGPGLREPALWLVHPARVAEAGEPARVCLARGKSAGGAARPGEVSGRLGPDGDAGGEQPGGPVLEQRPGCCSRPPASAGASARTACRWPFSARSP